MIELSMIERYLSTVGSAVAPGMANHLWQSTLLAIVAALLTLLLRKHHARGRYWLWLAASVKFLIPLSLLVAFGSHLVPPRPPAGGLSAGIYLTMEQISQPFTHSSAPSPSPAAPSPIATLGLNHFVPVLFALWLSGFLAVLIVWGARWWRVSAAMKSAVPLSEGRELEALRRIERLAGLRKPIAALLSRSSLEPGIFGILQPVLVWPEGISRRLEETHLEAILAHEVWHVRRRDNLFATIHMLVEAIFWFHPLVWWVGSRLVEERERACDEEVLQLGSDRQVYAESILKVCEFCVGSPLFCVSGVTGADLKKRMVHIMTDRRLHQLGFVRKLLLGAAALLAVAVPITFGLMHPSPSQAKSQPAEIPTIASVFEAVSIKPNKTADVFKMQLMFSLDDGTFTAKGVTLRMLIHMAYRVQDTQLIGGPDWLNTDRFDIDAKLTNAVVDQLRKRGPDHDKVDDQLPLKSLLNDYFKLAVHSEARDLQVYDLVVAESGPKLKESKGERMIRLGRGELASRGVPISLLADELSRRLDVTVVDKTGLKSNYVFNLRWTPDASEDARLKDGIGGPASNTPSPEPQAPPLLTAVQEQLGLKLEPRTDRVQTLVVDHAESPSEN